MKVNNHYFFIIMFLITLIGYSQSFNYQAVVRNSGGDIVANQSIGVQLSILQGSVTGTNIYTETHSVTSNAYGVISLAIGSGTTSGDFTTINWSTQDYWLNVAVDVSGGTTYVAMGTSKLQHVPYSSYANTSGDKAFSTNANVTSNAPGTIATDDFVFGSNQLDDIDTTTDDNNRILFDKSKGAFRAGNSTSNGWNNSVRGNYSIGLGQDVVAGADNTIAIGSGHTVTGVRATAIGSGNLVTTNDSYTIGGNNVIFTQSNAFALGFENNISGFNAFTFGLGLDNRIFNLTTLGTYNRLIAGSDNSHVATDPLFLIGNGIDISNRSNALVMLKNGNTTLNGSLTIDGDNQGAGNSYTLPTQDGNANQIMQTDGSGTVSWVNATGGGSGAFSTTTNVTSNTPGTIATDDFVFGSTQLDNIAANVDDNSRMFFDKSKGAFRAGATNADVRSSNRLMPETAWDEANIGLYSFAGGRSTIASGASSVALGGETTASSTYSVAIGSFTTASNLNAIAMGANTTASGNASFAVGSGANASGTVATAFGGGTIASGSFSTAIGASTASESFAQATLGSFNTIVTPNSAVSYNAQDRLLVIGNGDDDANRSDALVMLKNGNTILNGNLTIDGDNQGVGTAYTLPAQDGTTNQIMQTNGSGTVSWVNAPSGGSGALSTTGNVTSNAPGTIATDDFVFGSSQLADDINTVDDNRRMFFDKSKGAFRAGETNNTPNWDDANVGNYSFASGRSNTASGEGSIAMGSFSVASTLNAVALGSNTIASGVSSLATGSSSTASGAAASAFGGATTASGNISTAMGAATTAESYAQTTLGTFNTSVTPNSAVNYNAQDRLLVVGNGDHESNRSDALVMLKNGNTTLNGELSTNGLKVNNLPSFASSLNTSHSFTSVNTWEEINTWRVTGSDQLHNIGNHFNITTGRFTAPVTGLYDFSTQIRVDGVNSGWVRVVLAVNQTPDIFGGFQSIEVGRTDTLFQTLNVGGVMRLNQGDTVSLYALTSSDNSWAIQIESGFTGYLINKL